MISEFKGTSIEIILKEGETERGEREAPRD
jgi:hypothetical protein